MLLVKTIIKKSSISGQGCFTEEDIQIGQIIWKEGPMDMKIHNIEVSEDFYIKDWIYKYGTYNEKTQLWEIDGDNARYMNHHKSPNIKFNTRFGYALTDIPAGTELTCNYREITSEEHFNTLLTS